MKGNINSDMLLFVEPAGRANADGSWESSRPTRPCLRAVRYGFHASQKAAFRVPRDAGRARQREIMYGPVGERGQSCSHGSSGKPLAGLTCG